MKADIVKKVNAAARQSARGLLSPLILGARGVKFSPSDSIIISGYFRSGTTWLAELISKSVNGGIIFEPFHIDHVPEARRAGFTYNSFRAKDDDWPEGFAYVDKVLRGKVLNRWTAGHMPLKTAFNLERLVIKLVSSNQVLLWLTQNFDVPPPALILRHPCAVLASWLNRGWRLNHWIVRDPELMSTYPELADIMDSLSNEEEFFAARWCVDHFVPMASPGPKPFYLVPFEKLVIDGPQYLEEVLATWGFRLPDEIRDQIRRPSEKASGGIEVNYESVLGGWKNSLSRTQIDGVLRVVRDFGLDFYTNDIEPDYDRLFSRSRVRVK